VAAQLVGLVAGVALLAVPYPSAGRATGRVVIAKMPAAEGGDRH
jgi:hypothetical protein